MGKPGAVLDIRPLGVVVELRRTAEDTGGAYVEFDVVGRARGMLSAPHVHPEQTERHEVIEGAMALTVDGRRHVLRPGDPAVEVPPGATHSQKPHGPGAGRVRVQLRPAGAGEAFLRRLAEIAAAGALNRLGFPKPLAGAALVRDFGDVGHPPRPSLRTQRRLAGALLAAASREYVFVDEWDVAAPREAVFDALADARTYPDWWRPVYVAVQADGPPAVGARSSQHFKGRLPYHLHTSAQLVRLERPQVIAGEVEGDLRGTGVWTLTEVPSGTHVRFDWRVHADRPLLRVLTPVLRPALRWNHAWAIRQAVAGLEPYARQAAAASKAVTA